MERERSECGTTGIGAGSKEPWKGDRGPGSSSKKANGPNSVASAELFSVV